jgi:hypothetical protein
VARDELEDCIQQVRDRVEHIVSEGLASTVAPLQQQIKADSQHTSQMCVRMDALDAQQKVGHACSASFSVVKQRLLIF